MSVGCEKFDKIFVECGNSEGKIKTKKLFSLFRENHNSLCINTNSRVYETANCIITAQFCHSILMALELIFV